MADTNKINLLVWGGYGENESCEHHWMGDQLMRPFWETMEFLRTLQCIDNDLFHYWASFERMWNPCVGMLQCTPKFTVALFADVKVWNQSVCQQMEKVN